MDVITSYSIHYTKLYDTDSQGSDSLNQKLSEDRAAAVKNYLVENGIDASRLSSVGYGERNNFV